MARALYSHLYADILQDYFTKILEDSLEAVVKPQYVDQIPKAVKGDDRSVGALIKARAQMENVQQIMDVLGMQHRSLFTAMTVTNIELELNHLQDRNIELLSGGELQRFAIALTCIRKADVYVFNQPSSGLSWTDSVCTVTCSTSHHHSSMSSNVLQPVA